MRKVKGILILSEIISVLLVLLIVTLLFKGKKQEETLSPVEENFLGTRWIAQETDFYIDVASGYRTGENHKSILTVNNKEHILVFHSLNAFDGTESYFVREVHYEEKYGYAMDSELFTGEIEWQEKDECFIFHISHCDLLGDLEQLTFVRARIPFAELPQNAPKKYQLSV